MDKRTKIHCVSETNCNVTLCERVETTVISVGGYVFVRIKHEHKCLHCLRVLSEGGAE